MFQSRVISLLHCSNNCHPETIANDHIKTVQYSAGVSTLKVLPVKSSSHLPTSIFFPETAVRDFWFSLLLLLLFITLFRYSLENPPGLHYYLPGFFKAELQISHTGSTLGCFIKGGLKRPMEAQKQ